jgi:hypothetical protein
MHASVITAGNQTIKIRLNRIKLFDPVLLFDEIKL